MFAALKSYVAFLARHWVMTLVLLFVVALFLAAPLARLAARIPGLSRFAGGAEAA